MPRNRALFNCSACGAQAAKWAGQCPDCGAWNTLVESADGDRRAHRHAGLAKAQEYTRLAQVEARDVARISSGIDELDRVLGGGFVPGSVVLLGGDPGIGKSTLLLQSLAGRAAQIPSLYVSGEESARQVALRARRLAIDAPDLGLLADNSLTGVLETCQARAPQMVVVDSIQTLYSDELTSAPGSVAQVRETAARLVRFAKQTETVMVLVGHVTKEGAIAGPRVLEHMVDTVLYFEGDTGSSYRLIRTIKNRFGAVNEVGVFAMTESGLRPVSNPSAMFLNRDQEQSPGRVTLVTQEGTRPLLVEVQALVDRSPLANPRRLTVGLDTSRLAMLLAVLHRHAGCALYDQDVFVNVVGGVRVSEPAADMAVTLAVLSSLTGRSVARDIVVFGEVGLAGEIRPVQRGVDRLREAAKLGFARALLPRQNVGERPETIQLNPVRRVQELEDWLL